MAQNGTELQRHAANRSIYCPICTRTVEGEVVTHGKTSRVRPGQRCPRCASSLDAGYVIGTGRSS